MFPFRKGIFCPSEWLKHDLKVKESKKKKKYLKKIMESAPFDWVGRETGDMNNFFWGGALARLGL